MSPTSCFRSLRSSMGRGNRKKSPDRKRKPLRSYVPPRVRPSRSDKKNSVQKSYKSASARPTSTVWENIVLHYLNKLRNAFGSSRLQHQGDKLRKSDDLLKGSANSIAESSSFVKQEMPDVIPDRKIGLDGSGSQNSLLSFGSGSFTVAKKKAYNIVTNALEYGRSKGIISRNGKFFWIRDKKGSPVMQMCKNCKTCQSLAAVKSGNRKGILKNRLDDIGGCRKRFKTTREKSGFRKRTYGRRRQGTPAPKVDHSRTKRSDRISSYRKRR